MITSLNFKIIPHAEHRYPTVGDYWEEPPGSGHWEIRVSDVGDWQMALLVFVHEIVELCQTEAAGIKEQDITAFDIQFEAAHANDDEEPGDSPWAPYHKQHVMAECLERILALILGINWQDYDDKLMEVWRPKK